MDKYIVKYEKKEEWKISEKKVSYEKCDKNMLTLSEMSDQGVIEYLHCLKKVHEIFIIDRIVKSKTAFILKPRYFHLNQDDYSYGMPKGEDIFNSLYSKHDEDTVLLSFENRKMLYCFIYCLVESCREM